MICLTRLNREKITINSDIIECLEHTPDTVVKLTNGQSIMVLESVEEVVEKVLEFRRKILCFDRSSSALEDPVLRQPVSENPSSGEKKPKE